MGRLKTALLAMLFLLPGAAPATKLKGYPRGAGAETESLERSVLRVKETAKNFFVLLSNDPAFYRFPKRDKDAAEIRAYLNKTVKSGKKIRVTVDLITAEILLIEEQIR